jgi:ectoine hydroxylase-related dioxygenase (phytanoyl-CoA dioxygenase family)
MAGGQFGTSTVALPPAFPEGEAPPEFVAAAAQFWADGFTVVRNLLGPAEMARVLAATEAFERLVLPQLPPHKAFFSDPTDLRSVRFLDFAAARDHAPEFDMRVFEGLYRHPRFAGLAQACLGEPVVDSDGGGEHRAAPSLFNKTAGKSAETPPHQDNHYFCLVPPQCLTVWLALDPVTAETGCLRYTPRSHLPGLAAGECLPHEPSYNLGFSQQLTVEGRRLTAAAGAAEAVLDDLRPGDAVVHHCQTVHRAEENTAPVGSGLRRRAMGIVYVGASARVDEVRHKAHLQSILDQGVIDKSQEAKL